MELDLFVSWDFAPCREAERVWREAGDEKGIAVTVIDIDLPDGGRLAQRMGLTVVPAIALNGCLLAVGVQTIEEARDLIAAAANAGA